MSSWEQRMAAAAAERKATQDVIDEASREAWAAVHDPHYTHHSYMGRCSCGAFMGSPAWAMPADGSDMGPLICDVCGLEHPNSAFWPEDE